MRHHSTRDLGLADRRIATVLDLGGGTGRAGRAIGPETVIFDASEPMLSRATANGYPAVRGDVRSLPLDSESVDAVVSVDAIHHLPAIESVIAEVERVLRPGGVFVVRDFDPTTVRGRGLSLAERVVGFESTFFPVETVVDRFEEADLVTTVLGSGFVYTVAGRKLRE
ncbi:MAG: class I SAM-dependent methyltransferase [Halodesulfurarchaeum sp.]|nr:class I SAM-dependent methyltransferase [Halodesulfurarchaeum sp.]